MGKFLKGFLVPIQGFFLVITNFKLFMLAIIPFWMAVFAAIYLIYNFWSNSQSVMLFFIDWLPGFNFFVEQIKGGEFSLFTALLQGLIWVFLILFSFYFSYIILCILGAPFYSLMADRILVSKGLALPVKNNLFRWLYTTLRMLMISLLKLIFFAFATGVLFVLSFWSFGIVLVPLVVCLMIAYDCIDFSLECMNLTIRQRWAYFKQNSSLFFGLAFAILIFSLIPGLFTISLPFFIAGGAEAYADLKVKRMP
jgi:uncharacterized protein involved in cysteine biosynthesis